MARIVIELTNRCNLACQHCFSGRHGGKDDLPLELLSNVLAEAKACGFDTLTFTGGDPTVYPRFAEALRLTTEAGYTFSFVTNGFNFAQTYKQLLPYRDSLKQITFSLDGATQETHGALRGPHSYRKVLQAMSICAALGVPFANNMVLSKHNAHELEEAVKLTRDMGSGGLRFGHLMHSPLTTAQEFDLTPEERLELEAKIWALQEKYAPNFVVAMAPGFSTEELFPCAPLNMLECNIDCQANVTKCCHLSSHGDGVGTEDIVGNLRDMSFTAAFEKLAEANERFRQQKLEHFWRGAAETDKLPCWYCSNYFKKLDWLKGAPAPAWHTHIWEGVEGVNP